MLPLIEKLGGSGCLERVGTVPSLFWFPRGSRCVENTYPFAGDNNPLEPQGGVWAKARFDRIKSAISRKGVTSLLDVGCGNGSDVTVGLRKQGLDVVGLEPLSSKAYQLSHKQVPTILGTVQDIERFGRNQIPNIGMFDSLQYVPSDENVCSKVFLALQPGGIFILTVPGVEWLFSSYDLAVGNLRRFSRRGLNFELEEAGFESIEIEGLFSFLVPLAIMRKVLPERPIELANQGSRVFDRLAPLFNFFVAIERAAATSHGLSLLAVARKPL